MRLSEAWRQAALAAAAEVEAVADVVEDCAPEQATYAAADAAVHVVLEDLLDEFGPEDWDIERRLKVLLADASLRGQCDG